jgi:hypothetical protein
MERRIFFSYFAAFLPLATTASAITQKNVVNGVTVAVTAGNLGPEATVWDIAVVVRASNGKKLSDDLLKSAVLVDSKGRTYKALAWEGNSGQGTYRAGVLKFIAIEPRPGSIELRIIRPGEKKPRSFSWLLGSGMVASHWHQLSSPTVSSYDGEQHGKRAAWVKPERWSTELRS